MHRYAFNLLGFGVAVLAAGQATARLPEPDAAQNIYYVGHFNDAKAADSPICGSRHRPCATLSYWNRSRRAVLKPGDNVRLAPGVYRAADVGPAEMRDSKADGLSIPATHHCIILDKFASGVTYSGRTADDLALDDHESVEIDLAGVSDDTYVRNNVCGGYAISGLYALAYEEGYRDVGVRDMKFTNPPRGGIFVDTKSATPIRNILFDRIRISGARAGGSAKIGRFDNSLEPLDTDCQNGGRTVSNVTIVDSEFDNNKGFPGGVLIACVDGAAILDTKVHDVCSLVDCAQCSLEGFAGREGCNDHDGVALSGAINVAIRNCEVYRTGEDGIDVGGHPLGKSHHILVEGCAAYENPNINYKVSGARYVILRHNFAWGEGIGFGGYSCPHNITVYNNTFWAESGYGAMFWGYFTRSLLINNIIRTKSKRSAVFVDVASTNVSNTWQHNNIHNERAQGFAVREFLGGEKGAPTCQGTSASALIGNCSIGYEPPPLPCDSKRQRARSRDNTSRGLARFRRDARKGAWFGPDSGIGDRWSGAPSFIDAASPSRENLALSPDDSVATNAGTFIMKANGAGINAKRMRVVGIGESNNPRRYFVGPESYPGATPDIIQIEGGATVTITGMEDGYISFMPPATWVDGAGVHLAWKQDSPNFGASR